MTAREAALTVLTQTETKNAYLNLVFADVLENANLTPQDTAFLKELVFGVYRVKLTLDYIIRAHSTLRLKKIEPKVLGALRLGVYQLLYMDKVPPHAAVSESVNLVKKHSRGKSAGFANAILRSVLREKDAGNALNFRKLKKDSIPYLSIKYSYPEELTAFFVNSFGMKRAESLLSAGNETPPLCVRVNTLKTTREELAKTLQAAGIETKNTPYTHCGLYLFGASDEARQRFSHLFTVQDQSSQLAALALNPKKGETVLDLCSAPGGKTTHIAELMENEGKIFAFDFYEKRLEAVKASAKRLALDIIFTEAADATVQKEQLIEKADKVLIDVPCSGLGIIRRKPDIKYKENICDFEEITNVQKKILNVAKTYVKPGGVLVYSTCTINKKENKEQIDTFLKENPDFSLDAMDSPHMTDALKERAKTGILELYPDADLTDGFFVCRMKKQG